MLSLNPSPRTAAASEVTKTTTTAASTSSTDGETPKAFAITSVAWAPSCGRSYHLVATGSRDGHVRIWRVKPPTPSEDLDGEDVGEGGGPEKEREREKWSASIVGDFDDHKSAVGRVEWNITGYVVFVWRTLARLNGKAGTLTRRGLVVQDNPLIGGERWACAVVEDDGWECVASGRAHQCRAGGRAAG